MFWLYGASGLPIGQTSALKPYLLRLASFDGNGSNYKEHRPELPALQSEKNWNASKQS
jgi:hypothetical protein